MKKEDCKKSSQQKDTRIPHIIELYQSGLSMREVGAEFGVTAQRVEQILKNAGVNRRKYTKSSTVLKARNRKRKILSKDLLLKLYSDERLPVPEILRRLDASRNSLYKSLEYHKIPKREIEVIAYSALNEEILRWLYLKEDLTAAEIARELGFATITIKKRLSKFGIRKRDKGD